MVTSTCGKTMTNVLVVEPDPIYRKLFPIWIRDHFGSAEVEVIAVANASEAEDAARRQRPDLLLTALELDGADGLNLAQRLRSLVGELRVIVISQTAYSGLRRRLSISPKTQFLAKPVGERTFVEVIDATLHCGAGEGNVV